MNIKIEQLTPTDDYLLAEDRLQKLKKTLATTERALKNAPAGTIYARKSNGTIQYFNKTKESPASGKYIKTNEIMLAKQLSQKRYNQKLKETIKEQIRAHQKFIAAQKKNDINLQYEKLPEGIKEMVIPVTLPDEKYAEIWQSEKYGTNPYHEIKGGFYTAKGEHVRSKSEVIIADMLNRMKVPYRYEYPVELKRSTDDGAGSYTAYPDFYCLNIRTRQEIILEHFGMMDNKDYAHHMIVKLQDYQNNGWLYGRNMIFTLESQTQPLNLKYLEKLIRDYLR